MAKVIVETKRNNDNVIVAYRFDSNKKFTPKDVAIRMFERGQLSNDYILATSPDGNPYLRTKPNSRTTLKELVQ